MPLYLFENINTGETREVPFSMNAEKVYNGEDGSEVGQWKRIFLIPQASIDANINPFDKNAFANSKYHTIGDMLDKSAELSERRAELSGGVDPIKKAALDNYAKKRHGKRHPSELKETVKKANDELKKLGIKFNLQMPKSRRVT